MKCPDCRGIGIKPAPRWHDIPEPCPRCNGTGQIIEPEPEAPSEPSQEAMEEAINAARMAISISPKRRPSWLARKAVEAAAPILLAARDKELDEAIELLGDILYGGVGGDAGDRAEKLLADREAR